MTPRQEPMKEGKKQGKRLTVKQYARKKHISARTVYRWIKAGIIESDQPERGYTHEIIV